MAKTRKTYTPQEALQHLQHLCSRSEKCTYDLRVKLRTWGISPADSEHIINRLQESKFVDDERYTLAYVREKLNISRWGVQKISRMLTLKQIPQEMASKALEELNPDAYREKLLDLLKKKAHSIKAKTDAERKSKLLRFAISRGYEYSLAYELISSLTFHQEASV